MKKNSKLNTTISNYEDLDYPIISDDLMICLERDFPDKLPRRELSPFELGKLVGQQELINKLRYEKQMNEET